MPKDKSEVKTKKKAPKTEEEKKKSRMSKMMRKVSKKLGSSKNVTKKVDDLKKAPKKKKEEKRDSIRKSMEAYFNGSISWERMLAQEELKEEEMADLCNEFDLMKSTVDAEDFLFEEDGDSSDDGEYF